MFVYFNDFKLLLNCYFKWSIYQRHHVWRAGGGRRGAGAPVEESVNYKETDIIDTAKREITNGCHRSSGMKSDGILICAVCFLWIFPQIKQIQCILRKLKILVDIFNPPQNIWWIFNSGSAWKQKKSLMCHVCVFIWFKSLRNLNLDIKWVWK